MDSRLRLDIEDNACGNVGTVAEDMYENGNKIGTNGLTQKKKTQRLTRVFPRPLCSHVSLFILFSINGKKPHLTITETLA